MVGRVGSLITQGVYSVATPFHPFGGAVDVIVVQQQDGTFRSTPWYVRFGKFQGVIKGAEKIVRIAVNGVEANFHMYLDNSGEAYFIREVDSGERNDLDGDLKDSDCKDSDSGVFTNEDDSFGHNNNESNADVCRLEHSVSDSGVGLLRDEFDSSGGNRIQRAESDGNRRYYEFEDRKSSLEGSVVSEYGSGRYENLEGEQFGESQSLNSEVVLVSVDGHILTAPLSATEDDPENVQLSTPQFHLGPGEGTEFCEGNEEFTSGDDVWTADYINQLNSSTANDASNKFSSLKNDDNLFSHQLQVSKVEEHMFQTSESQNVANQEVDFHICCDPNDHIARVEQRDACNSCSELPEPDQCTGNNFQDTSSTLETQCSGGKSLITRNDDKAEIFELRNDEWLLPSSSSDSPVKSGSQDLLADIESTEEHGLDTGKNDLDSTSVLRATYPEWKDGQLGSSTVTDGTENDLQRPKSEQDSFSCLSTNNQEVKEKHLGPSAVTESNERDPQRPESEVDYGEIDIMEPQTAASTDGMQGHASQRFEISLCRNELHAGMGLRAAAEVFDAHRILPEEYKSSAASILNNSDLVVRVGERYLPWDKAAPLVLGMVAFGLDLPVDPEDAIPVEQDNISKPKDDESVSTPTSTRRRWRLWPIPFRRVKTLEHTSSTSSSEEVFVDSECGLLNSQAEVTPTSESHNDSPHKQFIRTNVPTNEQIASLNLKDGQNMITFSFSTRVLGTQQVDAHIYLWKWNARIVISDVDGTITKSDVLGQFMPLVGKDWTQSGVARLFSAIKENGYQLLFLSARAIVQAYLTRSFLLNLKQDGKALPNGPVVISPDGLFPSLYREVIRRAPHEFKIACLEDIKKLFPSDYNPFYAGFGNRDTDELSYRKIGIPKGKIFIINPKGEVAISHYIDVRSYTSLHTLVNDMFPPTSLVEQEDFNSWNFWKVPLPDVDL